MYNLDPEIRDGGQNEWRRHQEDSSEYYRVMQENNQVGFLRTPENFWFTSDYLGMRMDRKGYIMIKINLTSKWHACAQGHTYTIQT